MNEQFQQYLLGILEKTGEFLNSELPEAAQQMLTFSAYAAYMDIISLNCIAGVFLYARHLWNKFTRTWGSTRTWGGGADAEGGRTVANVLTFLASIIYIANFFNYVNVLIKIYFAPKVFLLEYASDLVK